MIFDKRARSRPRLTFCNRFHTHNIPQCIMLLRTNLGIAVAPVPQQRGKKLDLAASLSATTRENRCATTAPSRCIALQQLTHHITQGLQPVDMARKQGCFDSPDVPRSRHGQRRDRHAGG